MEDLIPVFIFRIQTKFPVPPRLQSLLATRLSKSVVKREKSIKMNFNFLPSIDSELLNTKEMEIHLSIFSFNKNLREV